MNHRIDNQIVILDLLTRLKKGKLSLLEQRRTKTLVFNKSSTAT